MENLINKIHQADCLEFLKQISNNSIDSCVTDPPYGWSFMGEKWDYTIPSIEIWEEILRVLKPGAYILVACGTRTQHRMACNIEDAGFEIRDIIVWAYGSGFPKNLDITKAILKNQKTESKDIQQWQGWGTALKPAIELWTLARKHLSEKTVAENVLKYGTGGINIDGGRISLNGEKEPTGSAKRVFKSNQYAEDKTYGDNKKTSSLGRHPANLIVDDSEEVKRLFPDSGVGNNGIPYSYAGREYDNKNTSMFNGDKPQSPSNYNDFGSASRFFYCAKVNRKERNFGLSGDKKNKHPTIKPLALMKYLVKLITPKEGICLDPFAGSGTTLLACKQLNFQFIGIEKEREYTDTAEQRLRATMCQKDIFQ